MISVNALTQKNSEEEKILNLLADILVCERCVVRIFRGNFGEYLVNETEEPVKKGAHCSACLGILEGHTLNSVVKSVVDRMNENSYDSPTFQLGITVPQCIMLRQSSIITYLKDSGCEDIIDVFAGVKNVVKAFITKLIEKFTQKTMDPQSNLFIKIDFNFPGDGKEISKLDSLLRPSKRSKATDQPYRVEAIQKVVKGLSNSNIKKYAVCPPLSVSEACESNVEVYHSSIFIGGRYNKYSRKLSQTPWFVDGVRRGETSTLELIGERLKQYTRGSSIKFQSSGREDADVRMLGNGRPFSVEITDPKTTVISSTMMMSLQSEINSSTDLIGVRDLQFITKALLELMKKGEEEKEKTYRAKLWCPEQIIEEAMKKLNSMTGIDLHQKTPIRVLHRRPIATRIRKVHSIKIKNMEENNCYELDLTTQAGTYIKEFVHGDFGRTEPSLRTILGAPVDIFELDVMSIEMDWPLKLADGYKKEKENDINVDKNNELSKHAVMTC